MFREVPHQQTAGTAGFLYSNGVGMTVELEAQLDPFDPRVDIFLQVILAGQAEVNQLED